MPRYKVAHIREQGQDMILVPVESSFANHPVETQQAIVAELQQRTIAARLSGVVCLVWPGGFWAPVRWHAYFRSITIQMVWGMVNREVWW